MVKRAREEESTELANKRLKSDKAHVVRDRSDCPYLSTINRTKLNFDNERKCASTLQTLNIYMCLVCGELYHGRGPKTPAYAHALHMEHYIFMDTLTGQIWCVPDLYEVKDDSLTDIQHNNCPTYDKKEVKRLLSQHVTGHRIIDQTEYTVGYVGLNNLKETDYINAVLQPLLHVPVLAEHYMSTFSYKKEAHRSPLRDAFSELYRKVWNPYNFVGQVSPRSFVEVVSKLSKGKYRVAASSDPQEFLHFLLAQLIQSERKADKKNATTVVQRAFQGKMRVTSREHRVAKDQNARSVSAETTTDTTFLTLPLTLPSAPLVKEEAQQNIIQQEHLQVLLQKYNGTKETMQGLGSNRTRGSRYIITELPRYLILFFDRFTTESGRVEKNRALVNSPVANLDVRELCTPEEAARYSSTTYDLLSAVVHDGGLKDGKGGIFKTYQLDKQQNLWLEMEDLRVVKTEAQFVSVTEALIQVWELKGTLVGDRKGPLYNKTTHNLIQSYLAPQERVHLSLLCTTLNEEIAKWRVPDSGMEVED